VRHARRLLSPLLREQHAEATLIAARPAPSGGACRGSAWLARARDGGEMAASAEGSVLTEPSYEKEIFEAARIHGDGGVCPQLNFFGDKDRVYNGLIKVCYGFSWGAVSSVEQELLPGEGHGYDPIFYPDAQPTHSFASISLEQKNEWSHRGHAAKLLRSQFMK
jgi:hypothetical protein